MVKLHDKKFELYIPDRTIQERVKELSEVIKSKISPTDDLHFVVVLNGAYMFAGDLTKHFETTCGISFLKVSSYEGTSSTDKIELQLDVDGSLEDKRVIVVEDIVDSGNTIDFLINHLKKKKPKSIEICTCLFKPRAYTKEHEIDFVGFEIENEFVVGYGMDYNQLGRNLKDLHVISS